MRVGAQHHEWRRSVDHLFYILRTTNNAQSKTSHHQRRGRVVKLNKIRDQDSTNATAKHKYSCQIKSRDLEWRRGQSRIRTPGIKILSTYGRIRSVLMSSQSGSVGRIRSGVVGVKVDTKKGGVVNPSFSLLLLET